ncbi:hypothetical protein HPT27_17325 [Permianibacter sp. IMCC34836]|uniref:hypothetical protein n=1 Tax=Permianibacter fluminis TaxID=2738515 RepID=UPI001556BF07|nr:hypothetical protein [Permianibacter fluminis]NQD38782.1 hypothetical protein [Permianibacter fluminis]
MQHAYKYVLIAIYFVAIFIVLVRGNKFDSSKKTFFRLVLAVLVGWGLLLFYRVIIDFIDVQLAETQAQIEGIYAGDGAKNLYTLFYGWIPSLILVVLYWVSARGWLYFFRNKKILED